MPALRRKILHRAPLCVRFSTSFGRKNLRQSGRPHFISVSYIIIRMSKRERFMCRPRHPLRRCAAPPPLRQGRRQLAPCIHRAYSCPDELSAPNKTERSNREKCAVRPCGFCPGDVRIYTIGGLRASKQTLAEQVSKACDSPPTHFCRSSEARFRSVSVLKEALINSAAPSWRIFFVRFLSANPPHSFGYASGLPPQSDEKSTSIWRTSFYQRFLRRTSTRSLAKRGVCAEHAAITLCARES